MLKTEIHSTLEQTRLKAEQLSRISNIAQLPKSTQKLAHGDLFLGQQRAKQALEFAINMPFNDYHLCAIGTSGLGKRTKITQYLQNWVQHQQSTEFYDVIYVHHFKHKTQPLCLKIKHGQAYILQNHLANLWLNIITQLKTHSSRITKDIQLLLTPLFEQFQHDNITSIIQEHHADFQQYLQDYLQHISYYVDDILAHIDNDYALNADIIFDFLPDEYQLHIVVHHTQAQQPIIYEPNPNLTRLFGEISGLTSTTRKFTHGEYISHHFSIQAGQLLHANGGFLILDLKQVMQYPTVWHLLKQCLKNKQFDWHNLKQTIPENSNTQNLKLAPIPLNIKVILLCDSHEFDDMLDLEPEFTTLFKIRADFTDSIARTDEHELAYIQNIANCIRQKQLLDFERSALAEVLTEFSRQAEDQNLLLLHDGLLTDILQESHYYAVQQQAKSVNAQHVQTALKQRQYRLGYWRDLYWQDLSQGTQLIETKGVRLGQVNALSVIHFADTEFGFPSRLTASVSQGAGDILDIERSVELGGSLHAKGTLLMSSFLKSHFGRQQILNFSAALAFEQSYGEVDGDSATVAELCALISAISQIPIQQSWAITGSMNQLGQVQPVGGINAKIEGFFDTCVLQGLTGQQGVIIPRSNTQHLMLRADIIQAVADGKFHIHAIDHVEQAMEILMNRPIGQPDKKGCYPQHSIYEAVLTQLANWQDEELLIEEPKKKKKSKK